MTTDINNTEETLMIYRLSKAKEEIDDARDLIYKDSISSAKS